MIKTEQLYYLVEVSKYNSITLAAKEMFLTKAALSTAIRQLEKECGFEILERTYRGIKFTEKGADVLEYAKQILNLCDDILKLKDDELKSLAVEEKYDLYVDKAFIAILQNKLFKHDGVIFNIFNVHEINKYSDMAQYMTKKSIFIVGLRDNEYASLLLDTRIKIQEVFQSHFYPASCKNTKWLDKNAKSISPEEWKKCPKIFCGEADEDAENVILATQNVNVYTSAILNDLGIGLMTKFYDSVFAENHNLFKFYKPLNQELMRIVIIADKECDESIIDNLVTILK